MSAVSGVPADSAVLGEILRELREIKERNKELEAKVDALHGAATLSNVASPSSFAAHTRRLSGGGLSPLHRAIGSAASNAVPANARDSAALLGSSPPAQPLGPPAVPVPVPAAPVASSHEIGSSALKKNPTEGYYSDRVILSTYPGQSGIKPLPLVWGAQDPQQRGVIVASRHPNSIKVRNAIGAYGGFYSVYRALAIAQGKLNPNHRPNYTDTQPPFDIPPNPAWFDPKKIVTLDPFGHLAPTLFKSHFDAGIDVRPTSSLTRAHIKMAELDAAVLAGRVPLDGKIVVTSDRLPGTEPGSNPGVEINCSKAAVEPVWFLPGVAERLGVPEGLLRRALFEDTGGMYPELLTRSDLSLFLPPISGLTVYIFGPPEYMRDPTKEVTVRVHDECNGSDVFGSDICTCRPYLIYGIEEAIKCAQRGGSGVIVYFRKEGRALGEVTKYLVYNARKRGIDSAHNYFKRTEVIAGVEDMRFQSLGTPDILHWLGITKIDNMISMSNLKHDAIVNSGIPIHKRYEIPPELIPADSQVFAGYFSAREHDKPLEKVVGRGWEDVAH
ncbi:gtp cyclohydrolase ii [Ceraceosorus bombacis]|uniref:Gtp cyclohydrolase ii n=1 Tax=Ceraceosorus bombacis TaxID=401625 RepID=A0A0N7LB55_9BASI|nr:gtp cyclohydrolase ii [Ceraceosorus bombacis]